ncbi:hypothetical protein IMSAGC016_01735 [Muribaculaceae bacterium]|nr:hypothetical protein IMSAGC016_01735 [Muribaculaceae bacterium]
MDLVDAVAVDMLQIKGIVYSEVSAYLMEITVFSETTHYVHPRFEDFSFAMEALQTTPDDSVLFKNGHFHSVSCKESPGEKSADAASYYYAVCLILHIQRVIVLSKSFSFPNSLFQTA